MAELLLRTVDSLAAGAACALVAAGVALSLVVRRPVNLSMLAAPGAAMLVGGAISGTGDSPLSSGSILLLVLCATLACSGIWLIVDQLIDRPVRAAVRPVPLLTSAGVLLLGLVVLERAAALWPMALGDRITATSSDPQMAGASLAVVDALDVGTWVVAISMLGALSLVMTRTKTGLAMRAVGYRPQTASMLGINAERLIAIAMVMAACLAAVGGLLYGVRQGRLELIALIRPGLIAAIALAAAGPGRPVCVVLAAIGLGTAESFAAAAWPAGESARNVALLIIGIAAVLARPADWRGDGIAAA